jgi:hypothetical protein
MAGKPHRHSGTSKQAKQNQRAEQETDPQTSESPSDYAKVGPRSVQGLEASELPDKGRGPVETNIGKELRRKLPQDTGAIGEGTDVGMRATPDSADAKDHGHRKHN